MRMWLVGSLAAIGFIAAIYGYGEYKATTAIKTSSQVEATGAASTPSPPPSTTGQGGVR